MALFKWIFLAAVILVLNFIVISIPDLEGNLTVSQLLDNGLIDKNYKVEGVVKEVLEDHVSLKGFRYSQFIVTDGIEDIFFFCSQKYGMININKGDKVIVEGRLIKYYNQLELSGFCSEIIIV